MHSPEELYDSLKKVKSLPASCTYTLEKCYRLFPIIQEIQRLKAEKNAVILAHSYVHPDIIYGVADFVGDSFELSKKAKATDAKIILFPAVRFMAESAKILNPEKTVIDPNPNGGCSLADSIEPSDLLRIKEKYPDYTYVCYINSSAHIKALSDVVVTSSNVYRIVERIENEKIYLLPDEYLAHNVKSHLKRQGIQKTILAYPGKCHVHQEYKAEEIDQIKTLYPGVKVIAHPECSPEVVRKADLTGSTSKMFEHVKNDQGKTPFLLLTECGIAGRLQIENPELQLVGSCQLCKYMRSNHLESLLQSLKDPKPSQIIEIEENIRIKAMKAFDKMFAYAETPSG